MAATPASVTVDDPSPVFATTDVTKMKFRGYLLTVAIDIGTSASCYAYAYNSSSGSTAFKINLSSFKPAGAHSKTLKTPTTILTETGPDGDRKSFGYKAEKEYRKMTSKSDATADNLYTDFKMALYRKKNVHKENMKVQSLTGTERPLLDVYVMTLMALKEHMQTQRDKSGASLVNDIEVRWVLCVPATWNEQAKDFLRHAAHKAGLTEEKYSDQLLIILESTAAALYCQIPESRFSLRHLDENKVPVGTKYLVIDAGAGTVDFAAQEVLEHNRVKEIAIATGGDWGGRHADKEFTQLLEKVIGKDLISEFSEKHPEDWYEIQLNFEQAKCDADPEEDSIEFNLPQPLFKFIESKDQDLLEVINTDSAEHGLFLNGGLLTIAIKTINLFYEESIENIVSTTKVLLQSESLRDAELKDIFLVGGFASCELLQSRMRKEFPEKRISVPEDAQAAVVKGAVMYGLDPLRITRIARKTYGIKTYSAFDPAKHRESKKKCHGNETLCQDLFLPFVQQEEVIEPGTHGTVCVRPMLALVNFVDVAFYTMNRQKLPDEVLYVDSEDVKHLKTVRVQMPNKEGGLNREVQLNFSFDDEIRVVAKDLSSDTEEYIEFTFDYDVRE